MDPNLLGSKYQDWSTPVENFYDKINEIWQFNLDVAATPESAKAPAYFTPDRDGLTQEWFSNYWCNPPFRESMKWFIKGVEEKKRGVSGVFLLPARNDTKLFHDYIWEHASRIVMVKGRLKFDRLAGRECNNCKHHKKNKVGLFGWCKFDKQLVYNPPRFCDNFDVNPSPFATQLIELIGGERAYKKPAVDTWDPRTEPYYAFRG